MGRRRLAIALLAACAVTGCGGGAGTASDGGTASRPASLADRLAAADARLRSAIHGWRLRGRPPGDVLAAAATERAIVHTLAESPARARETIGTLRPPLRGRIRLDVKAAVDLRRLAGPPTGRHLHLVPPPPAAGLLADYRRAGDRFGVRWQLLAAVNLVESAFGRVVNRSSAGAQGPMQFLPSTWRAYGLGGDVHDSGDAILGAANYLHRSGAGGDERGALFAYNRSTLYVDAVLAYAHVMTRDPLGFGTYYAWEASLPSVL